MKQKTISLPHVAWRVRGTLLYYSTVQLDSTLYTTKWGPVKEENIDQDVIQCDQ